MRTWMLGLCGALLFVTHATMATTTRSVGAGSAVTVVDRSTTFDTINASYAATLDSYSENLLGITTSSSDSWGTDASMLLLNPFHDVAHGPSGADHGFWATAYGSDDWLTIMTIDATKMYGIEFLYGNTWTTGDIYGVPWGNANALVEWETYLGNTLVSSGSVSYLAMGSVLGFYDSGGIDRLLVRATIANTPPDMPSPPWQAIALDNLNVQLSPTGDTPVPEPGTVALLGLGLAGLRLSRRRSAN